VTAPLVVTVVVVSSIVTGARHVGSVDAGLPRSHSDLAELGCESFMVAAVGRGRGRGERGAFASVAAKSSTARNRHLFQNYRVRVRARNRELAVESESVIDWFFESARSFAA
jgi:hypothetical protein